MAGMEACSARRGSPSRARSRPAYSGGSAWRGSGEEPRHDVIGTDCGARGVDPGCRAAPGGAFDELSRLRGGVAFRPRRMAGRLRPSRSWPKGWAASVPYHAARASAEGGDRTSGIRATFSVLTSRRARDTETDENILITLRPSDPPARPSTGGHVLASRAHARRDRGASRAGRAAIACQADADR